MVKMFERTPAAAKRIEKAMARLDAARVRKQKAAAAAAVKKRMARKRERSEAARVDYRPIVSGAPTLQRINALAGWKVMCARLEPGTWYTAGQIRALMPDYAKGSVKAWLWQLLPKAGLVERAGNPDYDPRKLRPGQTGERYLYALTATGASEAAGWRCELGMGSDT
jgi:hypothetical protein